MTEHPCKDTRTLRRNARLTMLGVLLMTSLSACNTVSGAGKDTSAIGHGVTRGAEHTQAYINQHT